ncbi:hypothetical protein FQR65_LT10849 [Abscondita terminalis]|nr:hypothetical protein FQR65_LT10849 [Abscondita terminalis]
MSKRFFSKRNYCKVNVLSDVHADSIDMSYKVFNNRDGPATPLIVLHGLLSTKLTWKSFCNHINEKSEPARKVMAVDLRDHGDSPRTKIITYPLIGEDIKKFLIKHNIKKSCFLGHCFGGRGLMWFALKYPDFIDRIIIADASTERATPFQTVVPEMIKQLKTVKLPLGINIIDARHEVKTQLEKNVFDKRLINFFLTNLYVKSDGRFV